MDVTLQTSFGSGNLLKFEDTIVAGSFSSEHSHSLLRMYTDAKGTSVCLMYWGYKIKW